MTVNKEAKDARELGRELARKIDAFLTADGGDARYSRHRVIVSWGPGLGQFQSLSVPEAEGYLALLDAGERGAPWKLVAGAYRRRWERHGFVPTDVDDREVTFDRETADRLLAFVEDSP